MKDFHPLTHYCKKLNSVLFFSFLTFGIHHNISGSLVVTFVKHPAFNTNVWDQRKIQQQQQQNSSFINNFFLHKVTVSSCLSAVMLSNQKYLIIFFKSFQCLIKQSCLDISFVLFVACTFIK